MRRNPVRSASLLLIILLLALGTTSAPVSAGAMTGGNPFAILLNQPVGTCAFIQISSTGHYFVAQVIGATTAPGNPNNHANSFQNVLVTGPFNNKPDDLAGCTDLTPPS